MKHYPEEIPAVPYAMPYAMPMPALRLARAHIPNQPYMTTLPLDKALMRGTLFPELSMPYSSDPKECKCEEDVQWTK